MIIEFFLAKYIFWEIGNFFPLRIYFPISEYFLYYSENKLIFINNRINLTSNHYQKKNKKQKTKKQKQKNNNKKQEKKKASLPCSRVNDWYQLLDKYIWHPFILLIIFHTIVDEYMRWSKRSRNCRNTNLKKIRIKTFMID